MLYFLLFLPFLDRSDDDRPDRFYSPLSIAVACPIYSEQKKTRSQHVTHLISSFPTNFIDKCSKLFDQSKRFMIRYIVNENKRLRSTVIIPIDRSKISLSGSIPEQKKNFNKKKKVCFYQICKLT